MNRRTFLQANGSIWAGFVLTGAVPAVARTLSSSEWRSFEVVTSVELLQPKGEGRIWLPAVLTRDTPYQRTLSNRFSADGGVVRQTGDKQNAFGIVSAAFPAGTKPRLTLASRVLLRNYSVDLSSRTTAPPVSRAELSYFLQPSRYVPTDGIVRDTAAKVTAGATSDVDKARAIYEWIVDNTFRDPKVRGCCRGDIRFTLESGDLGGKCADLNALYVGLARSVGLPARHVYGLRIAKSEFGYKSLGLATDNATKGQHCRAEVFLREHGWVPVDPADVRKVVLEEPPAIGH